MRTISRSGVLLFWIILLGLAVRIIGVDFGLPLLCHNDESVIVNYALAYGKGDLNPHFFKVPPFLSYLMFFLYGIFFLAGKILGSFQNVMDFGYRFLADPTAFYLIGRLFCGVFFGTMTIPLMYLLGKRVFNERTGLLAALFLSMNFLHVRNSHYIYFDIPLVFFTVLFFIILYKVFEKNKILGYMTGGLVLGIAISVKYSAVILAVPASIISAMNILRFRSGFRDTLMKNIAAFLFVVLGMFVSNPYMFIDHPFFLDTISRMPFFTPPFWFHLKVSLVGALGFSMCVAALVGGFISLKKRNRFSAVLLSFFICYYLVLTRSSQLAERYVFPIVPIALLMAAYCVDTLISKTKKRNKKYLFGTIFCVLLMFPSAAKVYYSDRLFTEKDTRQVFRDWANENIPAGTKIAIDGTGELTSVLPQNRGFLKESFESFTNPKFDVPREALEYKVKLIMENPYTEDKEYNIYYIKTKPGKDRFLGSYPEIYLDIQKIRDLGIKYIVLNKLLLKEKKDLPFLLDVENNTVLVKDFSPYKKGIYRIGPLEQTIVPAGAFSLEELQDRERLGPVIRVYRLKDENEE